MKPASTTLDLNLFFVKTRGPMEIAWYKWEFLRRNPAYRADYNSFIDKFGGWLESKGFWYDSDRRRRWTASDQRIFRGRIAPALAELCQRWKISNVFPPGWRFSKKTGLRKLRGRSVFLPTGTSYDDHNWNPATQKGLEDLGFSGSGESAIHYRHLLLVGFNLNWPLADLLGHAESMLALAKKNWNGQRGARRATRRRVEDYDTHLRIWDLRSRGSSLADIAQSMFPHEQKANARQKVRDHLTAAKKMMDGQYADIS